MSQFENVTVVKKASVYFEGKVTSRTVLFSDGSRKTLGIMLPGEYEFGTDAPELMEILAGEWRSSPVSWRSCCPVPPPGKPSGEGSPLRFRENPGSA